MKSIICIIFFLTSTVYCFGQNNNVTKSELKNIFKKSIVQKSRKWTTTISNPWIADNINSTYYKSETIKLTNFKSNQGKLESCKKVNWTFYQNNKLVIKESQTCKEPSSEKVITDKDWFEIKIGKSEPKLVLELYNANVLVEKFEVVSLEDSQLKSELILKRVDKSL